MLAGVLKLFSSSKSDHHSQLNKKKGGFVKCFRFRHFLLERAVFSILKRKAKCHTVGD
jgi:hypothetical protein